MHIFLIYVQFFVDFLFSFDKTPYLCSAKIKINLYIIKFKTKNYV